jgi:hypothetical protein
MKSFTHQTHVQIIEKITMLQEVHSPESITTASEYKANPDPVSDCIEYSASTYFDSANIKMRTCKLGELMNLSPALNKFAHQKCELSYVCRKTGVLSHDCIMALLLVCPILITQVDNQYRILAGTRTWAIAITSLPPATKIFVLELKQCNKKVESLLAMLDYYVCGLFFSLSKAAIKLIQSSFQFFDKEQRNDALFLAPGIKTIDELAIASGVRTETTRKDRQAARQTTTSED